MNKQQFDLVIVGVGGQGTLLASKILGFLATEEGLGVKVSEVHGMSQRGGSVITHVRVGGEIFAPLVSKGCADYLISFEALEAARAADYLKKDGVVIVNTQRILPMPVITGAATYPDDPLSAFSTQKVEAVDALSLAVQAGSARAVNLVLLGMLSRHLRFTEDAWKHAIGACVPRRTFTANVAAFGLGAESIK